MADTLFPTFRKISQTPLRDLLRFRLTGRLNWKSRVAAESLPAGAADLITRVVKRTRLWRLEKATVTDELIAHFQDGLAAGTRADELVKRFGDERIAAKLIRRAKRRGRPMVWHLWIFMLRGVAVLIGIYAVIMIRFCIGQPTPTVNYFARLNDPILKTPEADRAWPLWRQALLAASDGSPDSESEFNKATDTSVDRQPWAQTAKWLDQHTPALDLARQAAGKATLGFVYGPIESQEQLKMGFVPGDDQPLVNVLLPHLSHLRAIGDVLSLDVRRATEVRDGARVESDLSALLSLARQLRGQDHFLVTQLVALGIDVLAVDRLQSVLAENPGLLSDAQLVRFAHSVAGPEVAADLISVDGERAFLDDLVQRIYTDDGHGDGRVTYKGVQTFEVIQGVNSGRLSTENAATISAMALIHVSRAEFMEKYGRLMDITDVNLHRPIRQTDWTELDQQMNPIRQSLIGMIRYAILNNWFPDLRAAQTACERYLGKRDGTLVAISLEIYHRRRGSYPASLGELVPGLLPAIPADRITGDPVKYRVINGKPMVYSVGADRIDDGGQRTVGHRDLHYNKSVAVWGAEPNMIQRGDWVLYPPGSETSN